MSLKEYKRKRDFRKTSEPRGDDAADIAGLRYVVQKHAASRLHYDFRLQLGDVLKSWAIPKGPSLDPSIKSLAVHVEDHPLNYATFEGVIPKGEYGGGTVMVWDQGTWKPEGDPAKAYTKGKLTFELFGEKLRGAWTLIRMGGRAGENGKNWLLVKRTDDEARSNDQYKFLDEYSKSVLTQRELEQIAQDADRVWSTDWQRPPRRDVGSSGTGMRS